MQPTAAPWAAAGAAARQEPLPAAARGETTVAPWAAPDAAPAPPVAVPPEADATAAAEPRFPDAVPEAAWPSHPFVPAAKRIASAEHLRLFLASPAARAFVSFLLALNDAARGRSCAEPCPESPAVAALCGALDALSAWVDDVPPAAHALRYGNPAFRAWHARAAAGAARLLAPALPPALAPAALPELAPYLVGSLGDATRIDYGTGHEAAFAALLFCLARLGVLAPADARALVARVFARYLALVRKVQTTYWLEPAGSHGVWGLDDYQFLPFLWGSAQLEGNAAGIKPDAVLAQAALDAHGDDYLYLGAVRFVRRVKRGALGETSPMLADIAGVPSWAKINRGMVKMYRAEVLGKLPIMQHFLFGSLLDWRPPA